MVCGIQKAQFSLFVGTLIQIGLVIKMIGNQPLGLANSLVGPWCVGLQRSKIVYLSPPLNLSMWQLLVLVLNYYG